MELLTPTRGPGKALSYSPEYGGTRGRSAVLLAGARVILYCSGDGTADAKTPEGLRDELVSIGCRYDQAAYFWLNTNLRLDHIQGVNDFFKLPAFNLDAVAIHYQPVGV